MPGIGKIVARHTVTFAAKAENLPKLHAAFDELFEAAQAAGVPVRRADAVPIVTAAGEIAANIIEHACVDFPGAEMTVEIMRRAHDVEIVFSDPGILYVPELMEAEPEPFPLGGMGLIVARASVHELDYSRQGDVNHWRLFRNTGLVAPEDGGPPVGADRTPQQRG